MTRELPRVAASYPDLACLAELGFLGKTPNNAKSVAIFGNSPEHPQLRQVFANSPPNLPIVHQVQWQSGPTRAYPGLKCLP
jgi:hypothetical protein